METRHLFISSNGQLLPRWQEAFPGAIACKPENAFPEQKHDLVWLRAADDQPVTEQLENMRSHLGDVKCVVLSDQPGDEQALQAFGAAARGYCNTHAAPAVLQQIASVVLQGGLWIGESLMLRVITSTARRAPHREQKINQDWEERLTVREKEIARLLARGGSNKEIARELEITERTVKAHVSSILEKLGVRDRLQVALRINGQILA